MNDQLELTPPRMTGIHDMRTPEQKFRDFHRENPQVYAALVSLARQLKAQGHDRYSLRGLFAVVRFNRAIRVKRDGADPWKLNDHYTPYYAREIMEREPDLAGFFETRAQKR